MINTTTFFFKSKNSTHCWPGMKITTLPDNLETVILTVSFGDQVYDYVFENVLITQNQTLNTVFFKSKKKSKKLAIFTIVDLSNRWETVIELASKYDGQMLGHNNSLTLFYNWKTEVGSKDHNFMFVTGYNKQDLNSKTVNLEAVD